MKPVGRSLVIRTSAPPRLSFELGCRRGSSVSGRRPQKLAAARTTSRRRVWMRNMAPVLGQEMACAASRSWWPHTHDALGSSGRPSTPSWNLSAAANALVGMVSSRDVNVQQRRPVARLHVLDQALFRCWRQPLPNLLTRERLGCTDRGLRHGPSAQHGVERERQFVSRALYVYNSVFGLNSVGSSGSSPMYRTPVLYSIWYNVLFFGGGGASVNVLWCPPATEDDDGSSPCQTPERGFASWVSVVLPPHRHTRVHEPPPFHSYSPRPCVHCSRSARRGLIDTSFH